jgi:chorismate mutase/prephenate dehydratase
MKDPIKRLHFLGPSGTFSEFLGKKLYPEINHISHPTISSICSTVAKDDGSIGLIPIENSSEGSVNESLFSLVKYDVFVVAEAEIQVNQCFFSLSKDISTIETLVSHPQSLGQCRNWIDLNFPNASIIPTSSNAEAMTLASSDSSIAAIGSAHGGDLYALNMLFERIQDIDFNVTKFNIVSACNPLIATYNKTSIVLSLPDDEGAGSLIRILEPFSRRNIPLTKIVSRPTHSKDWNYYFFIDFLGYLKTSDFNELIQEIQDATNYFKVLGSYAKSDKII